MSSYLGLRSSRSVLSLLRRYKPAQPPLTRCYQRQRAPTPLLPATHLLRGWLQRSWRKVVGAAFLAYFLPKTAAFAVFYAISHEETVPYTNRVHRVVYSRSDEKSSGDRTMDRIRKEHGDNILGPCDPDTVRVRRIADDIIRGIHRILPTDQSPCEEDDNGGGSSPKGSCADELDLEVIVVRNKRFQAHAHLGGKIVVHTGVLDYLDTDAEVATVLAHEIGHVIARHLIEITRVTPFPFRKQLLPFSRRTETEADHIGIMLLAAAGFDPLVAPKVWKKLVVTRGDSSWDDYIGSHPSHKTRLKLLSQDKVMEKALELYHGRVCAREGTNN